MNPYEGNDTSMTIINLIESSLDLGISIKKKFNDLK